MGIVNVDSQVGQRSRSRSRVQNSLYHRKGLVIRSTYAEYIYERTISNIKKVMANVEVFDWQSDKQAGGKTERERWYGQERALRFIYDDHNTSYEDLLMKSKLPSLKLRRIRTMALESFKIINKDCPVILQDLLTVKHNRYNFRYHNTVEVPHARTTRFGLQSFRHKAAATWNSLPDHVRCMSSFNQFKSFISNWDGPQCKCSACRR